MIIVNNYSFDFIAIVFLAGGLKATAKRIKVSVEI